MTTGKLCFAAFLCAIPPLAAAQPSVSLDVGVDVGADTYDTDAPGDPVESVDVFYDQLSPYGAWVDEPDVGRVFIPDTPDYVPYTTGHWQNTNLGFVWVSSEPHAWATTHYGRWAYSNSYGRWYWLPDTAWGPSWVEWRQTGTHFGWAPLAPEVVVRAGWQPPPQSWHYCGAEHVLDVNVGRYYEPRARVVEIHRDARPIEHYSTIGRVKVVVGPPAATLREHHVVFHRVRVEPRTVGRWTPAEAHAQVVRATEHRAAFEVQNQRRIEANAKLHAAHVQVIETHPQIRAQVNARVQVGGEAHGRVEPPRAEPGYRPNEPARVEPGHRPNEPARVEPGHRPNEPARVEPGYRNEPARVEPGHRNEPARVEPGYRNEPAHGATRPPMERAEHAAPQPPRQPVEHAPPRAPEPPRRAPEPEHAQPPRGEPPRGEHSQPERRPEHKDERH